MKKLLFTSFPTAFTGILFISLAITGQVKSEVFDPTEVKNAERFLTDFSKTGGDKDKNDYINLFQDLADAKWSIREKATLSLIEAGPDVLDHLEKVLRSPDPEVAMRARRIRDRINALEKKGQLDGSVQIQESALLLARSGNRLVPQYLLPLLNHKDEKIRETASRTLRRITRNNFRYHAEKTEQLRADSVNLWRNWWSKVKTDWKYSEEMETALLICDPSKNQVLALDLDGDLMWRKQLEFSPMVAGITDKGNLMVAYRGKQILQEISPAGKIIWSYNGKDDIKGIFDFQLLENGNILLTDDPGGQVIEITRKGRIVWEMKNLQAPHAAWRTTDGITHIAVHKDAEIISVNAGGEVLNRIEGQSSVSDIRPYGNQGSWIITRMGVKPQLILMDPDGTETKLYNSGWPVTSGLLTDEGLVFSANEQRGVVRGEPGDSLKSTGVPRNYMWGKIRSAPKGLVKSAAPEDQLNHGK